MGSTGDTISRIRAVRRRGSLLGKAVIGLGLCVLGVMAGVLGYRYLDVGGPARETAHGEPGSPAPVTPYVAAAPAVVEPGTQLVALRSERRGRIKAVLKDAGDRIGKGEPLVLLDDATAKALVAQRRADHVRPWSSLCLKTKYPWESTRWQSPPANGGSSARTARRLSGLWL